MDNPQTAKTQNVLDLIYKRLPYLNPALRRIGEFILEHPEQCKTMTIKQLATACEVAEPIVSRFVRENDLSSYQGLKILIADGGAAEKYFYEGISRTDSGETIIEKVMHRNIQTLTDTKLRLESAEVGRAVDVIENAGAIIFCCMGSSGVAAEEGVMRFIRAGKKCLLFRDQSIQLMTAAIVKPDDVLIGISNSGRSAPIVGALQLAQSNGVPTIAITSFEDAPITQYADVSLFTPTKAPPPGLDLYGEATTSVSAQILIIDVLYACFAVRNFDQTLEFLEKTYTAAIKDTRVRK
jgi:RpiR family carbohydrate utilization transcriptional regulator